MRTDDEIYEEMAKREDELNPVPTPKGEVREGISDLFENTEKPAKEWLYCDCDFSNSHANDVVLASLDDD